ncbi:MAG: hypothetical protein ACREMZ_11425 [Gemmatimonadales bacterium]
MAERSVVFVYHDDQTETPLLKRQPRDILRQRLESGSHTLRFQQFRGTGKRSLPKSQSRTLLHRNALTLLNRRPS